MLQGKTFWLALRADLFKVELCQGGQCRLRRLYVHWSQLQIWKCQHTQRLEAADCRHASSAQIGQALLQTRMQIRT